MAIYAGIFTGCILINVEIVLTCQVTPKKQNEHRNSLENREILDMYNNFTVMSSHELINDILYRDLLAYEERP